MEKTKIGEVINFFQKVGVAAITLSGDLKVGDKIVVGNAEDAEPQVVESMQIEKESIESASAGQSVGIKISGSTNGGAPVYKVEE